MLVNINNYGFRNKAIASIWWVSWVLLETEWKKPQQLGVISVLSWVHSSMLSKVQAAESANLHQGLLEDFGSAGWWLLLNLTSNGWTWLSPPGCSPDIRLACPCSYSYQGFKRRRVGGSSRCLGTGQHHFCRSQVQPLFKCWGTYHTLIEIQVMLQKV